MTAEIGLSKNVQEARELIPTIRKAIESFDVDFPILTKEIDWGRKKRGQGRRSGGMVTGSMSAAPVGIKKYTCIDMSKYASDWEGVDNRPSFDGNQSARYYTAREFGCNKIEAAVYALS